MPRPPDVPADTSVDVAALARGGATLDRTYAASDLPRLREADAASESVVNARLSFGELEGRATIDGELQGSVMLTCQRCMRPVSVPLAERFELIVVRDEADAVTEIGGREPIVSDPAHVNLRWLIEDQALLALPLVPMHSTGERQQGDMAVRASQADEGQKPFGNLRELLRQR